MRQADTDALGTSQMAVEAAAHLATAAVWLLDAPYSPAQVNSPAELAIHTVNHAMKRGHLGMLHRSLTEHLH